MNPTKHAKWPTPQQTTTAKKTTIKGDPVQTLYDYAKTLGVSIEYTNLTDRIGGYRHDLRHIRLQTGMLYRKERTVLAHELGHATYGDTPTMFSTYAARQERRANEWAAHFLINIDDYQLAEEKYGPNTEWIAQELGVLNHLVAAYERTLHRIGTTVYVSPKLGRARARYEVA